MSWLIVGIIGGLYMAWNIGANDVANSMGTSVGSRAITVRQAAFLAGILNVMGAFMLGSRVTDTIRKGIVDPSLISDVRLIVIGALSALIAASLWVTLSTWLHLPVSTTHSVVGAMVGFGLIVVGISGINWFVLFKIVLSWISSPILGAILGFLIFKFISFFILESDQSIKATRYYAPLLFGLVFFVIALAIIDHLSPHISRERLLLYAMVVGLVAGVVGYLIVMGTSRGKDGEYQVVERIFRHLQVFTGCYVAFTHGANDVANAVGPVSVVVSYSTRGALGKVVYVPFWLLLLGGAGIALGIATWGWRVMQTVGRKITEITPSRGFAAEFGGATTVLIATHFGLPISTTHTIVGSVIGVGFARGISALNLKVIRNILISWSLTVPIAALISIIIYLSLKAIIY